MRSWSNLLALAATINFLSLTSPALASSLTFNATGPANFDGDVAATAIGGIALTKGSVSLSGNTIEVNAVPDWLFDKHPVLQGVVFNQQVDSTGANPKVTGHAYFWRGEWLKELGRTISPETLTLTDGTIYSGHISSASDSALEMLVNDGSRKSVPFASISSITSPRSFTFEIPSRSLRIEPTNNSYVADAISIRFKPDVFSGGLAFMSRKPRVPTSTLPGTEGGISDKALTFMVINDITINTIANAIAIPIVFTRPTSLATRQLLFINGNQTVNQPIFEPQVWANGSIHFYPTH